MCSIRTAASELRRELNRSELSRIRFKPKTAKNGLHPERQVHQEARANLYESVASLGVRLCEFGVHLATDGDRAEEAKRANERRGHEELHDLVRAASPNVNLFESKVPKV